MDKLIREKPAGDIWTLLALLGISLFFGMVRRQMRRRAGPVERPKAGSADSDLRPLVEARQQLAWLFGPRCSWRVGFDSPPRLSEEPGLGGQPGKSR